MVTSWNEERFKWKSISWKWRYHQVVYIGWHCRSYGARFRFTYLNSILHIHFIHGQFGKRKTFISFQSANPIFSDFSFHFLNNSESFHKKVWAELDLDLTLYTDFRLKFTWNTSEVQRKLGRYTNILFIPRCLWGGHVVGWIAWVLLWKRKRNVHITHSLNGHPNTARQDEIILKRGKRKKQPPIVLVQVICNFSSWQNKIKLTAINISDAIE